MLNKFRTRFGAPGIVAVIALVLAMAGGAYAASNALTGKQKKEVEKIAKKFAGKPGANGAVGPVGPAGAAGKAGGNGAPGVSPVGTAFAGEASGCKEGGVKFVGANTTVACNGVDGETGFTETLPSEKSETGTYSFGPFGTGVTTARLPISFPIPVEGPVVMTYLKLTDEPTEGCPGNVEEPAAEPGNLCIYQVNGNGIAFLETQNPETGESSSEASFPIGKSGALILFELTTATGTARGNWIVTAP